MPTAAERFRTDCQGRPATSDIGSRLPQRRNQFRQRAVRAPISHYCLPNWFIGSLRRAVEEPRGGTAPLPPATPTGAGPSHVQTPWQAVRVEPVEINAGAWYLRALRADERVDDRPALAMLGEHHPDYVESLAAQWDSETLYSWAVCEPTTGELLAEVTLDPSTGDIATRARPGHEPAARTGAEAVQRFAAAMLD